MSVDTEETVVEEVVEVKMGSAKSGDLDIQFEGETLEVGTPVFLISDEEQVSLADGEYTLDESSETIVVKDGLVESMGKVEEEEVVEEVVEEKELAEEDVATDEVVSESVSMEVVQKMMDELRAELDAKLAEVIGMNADLKEEVVSLSKQDSTPSIVSAPQQMTSHQRILARIKANK